MTPAVTLNLKSYMLRAFFAPALPIRKTFTGRVPGLSPLAVALGRALLLLFFVTSPGYSQLPSLQWQQSFGGTNGDILYSLEQTSDGGYLLGGYSLSGTNGNKTSVNFGTAGLNGDFWVVRLDASGNKLWDKTYGGTNDEPLFCLRATADGGFVLGGSSNSGISGNKSARRFGSRDFWVVKIDANGGKTWDASFGATGDDILFSLQQTSDGGYILGGYSESGIGGNKTSPNYGTAGEDADFWVVRLDANGTNLWDRTYGGSGDDRLASLQEVAGGGFILAGSSSSPASTNSPVDGTKTGTNYGGYDYWIVRLDAAGNQLWDKSYGGSADDGALNVQIRQTTDGGFIVGGESFSGVSGNKTSASFGSSDYWVLRLDANGDKVWDRSYGGTFNEALTALAQTADGGFMLGGLSDSGVSGNKSSTNYGFSDCWLVRVNASGDKLWDQTYGGASQDGKLNVSLQPTSDGGWLLGGDSESGVSGIKTSASFGGADYWVLKLNAQVPVVLRAAPQTNIAQNGFHFFLSGETNQFYVIEKSATLQPQSWAPLSTNQLTGPEIELIDSSAGGAAKGFYRARRWP